jgi:queuosine precursor transporter
MTKLTRAAIAAAYLLAIVLANYAILHIGTPPPFPGGPHTLPVWPGIAAPSGVYLIGLILVLRDLVQRTSGPWVTLALIMLGTGIVALMSPALAVASALAFLVSEGIDFAIYTYLERDTFIGAVLISNLVSIVVDSIIFLTVAFGSLAFLDGQIIGKLIGTGVGLLIVVALDARRPQVAAQ